MRLHWWQFIARRHCPHSDLQPIYGDMIIAVGFKRLLCRRCGRFLDGPVSLAESRKAEGVTE